MCLEGRTRRCWEREGETHGVWTPSSSRRQPVFRHYFFQVWDGHGGGSNREKGSHLTVTEWELGIKRKGYPGQVPDGSRTCEAGFYVTFYLVGSRRLVGVGVLVSIMGSDHHSRDFGEFFCTRQSGSQSLTEWHLICNCLEKCIHMRRIRKRRQLVQYRGPSSTIRTYRIDHHSPGEMYIRQEQKKNSAQHISNRFLVVQIGLLL